MTTFNTTFRASSHGGNLCETFVPASHGRHLQITTMKRSSGDLSTTVVSVLLTTVSDKGYHSVTYSPFSDYYKSPVRERVRCTEKAIRGQHQAVLDNIQIFLDESKAFYDVKG